METLIVHPENKEQLTALKAFMKALKIQFEPQKAEFNLEKADVEQAYQEMRKGKYTVVKAQDLWK